MVLMQPKRQAHYLRPTVKALEVLAGLRLTQARQLWAAVTKASWSLARDFRQRALLFDRLAHRPERIKDYLEIDLSPARMVDLIESLHLEGMLDRAEASGMQERLLEHADKDGRWL
mgnify:CR=1 FL=1